MKLRTMHRALLRGCLLCLVGLWATVASSIAADANDPRGKQMALAIGCAMSGQQDLLIQAPEVKKTRTLTSLAGTIADAEFYFAGALVRRFAIDDTNGHLSGLIFHRDGLSRMITTHFEAAFQKTSELVITDVDLTPAYPPTPRSALFFVPADRVPAALFNGLTFKAALLKANQNAIPQEGKTDPGPRDYAVVAFLMDRQPPGIQMKLIPSGTGGSAQDAPHPQYARDGWCYAVLPATFAYNRGQEMGFQVFLQKGQTSCLVNTYSSHSLIKRTQEALAQRGLNPGPSDGQMGAQTRRAIVRFQQEQGLPVDGQPSLALLALLREADWPSAVPLVQTSLTALGYDPGPIDGQMGQQTTGAIRAYQKACGMPVDGKISAGLLCHLADAAGPQPVVPGSRINRFDAKMWPNELETP